VNHAEGIVVTTDLKTGAFETFNHAEGSCIARGQGVSSSYLGSLCCPSPRIQDRVTAKPPEPQWK
jgi:hypothetical protein